MEYSLLFLFSGDIVEYIFFLVVLKNFFIGYLPSKVIFSILLQMQSAV